MAISGSIVTGSSQGRSVTLSWEAKQDAEKNKSTISWTLKGTGTEKDHYVIVSEIRVTANDTELFYQGSDTHTECYYGTILASDEFDVTHDSSGNASLSFKVEAGIYQWAINKTREGSWTLTQISRATTPTLDMTSVEIDGSTQVHIVVTNKAVSAYTHDFEYDFGSLTGQTNGISTKTGVKSGTYFTPPLALMNEIPNATVGTCTLRCKTYNGSQLIGETEVLLRLRVPSSVVPTISSIGVSEGTSGIASKFGSFVQDHSTLAVAINASGVYGSTIDSYTTTIQESKYYGESFTSSVLTESGTLTVSTTVRDSRGRSAKKTTQVSVLPYFLPKITGFSVHRINRSGQAADGGDRIAVSFSYEVASVGNKNSGTYEIQYKKEDEPDSRFTTFNSGSVSLSDSFTRNFTSSPAISTDYAYTFRLIVSDYFDSDSKDYDIATAFTVMDFRSTGHGMAIGKVSEKDALEIAMDTEFSSQVKFLAGILIGSEAMADFVVDQGKDSNDWYYVKYNSGMAKCMITKTVRVAVNNSNGNLYYGDSEAMDFPFTFTEIPSINATANSTTTTNAFASAISVGTSSTKVRLFRGSTASAADYRVSIQVEGKWK